MLEPKRRVPSFRSVPIRGRPRTARHPSMSGWVLKILLDLPRLYFSPPRSPYLLCGPRSGRSPFLVDCRERMRYASKPAASIRLGLVCSLSPPRAPTSPKLAPLGGKAPPGHRQGEHLPPWWSHYRAFKMAAVPLPRSRCALLEADSWRRSEKLTGLVSVIPLGDRDFPAHIHIRILPIDASPSMGQGAARPLNAAPQTRKVPPVQILSEVWAGKHRNETLSARP